MSETSTMMLTILLRHDQSRTVGQLQEQLNEQNWLGAFPPEGTEIVSWVIAMGLGQIVTLRFPAEKLRDVNRSIESSAWGAFRSEMYATYDFLPIALQQRKMA
ncbi:hypothetical protein [Aquamicrobium sp. LC103]|uniref:hypothetical protein n=1 Tax=Aquamicrobium sp. LC103 TaxID=1120658 RepID=UPI00063EA780|nr:hypothetical protein [Aquamicrobium sp. LC103]TKT69520.1 hypothetical protein XW59_027285 [Aquamicrobium sp. LC103]